ncbi:MAG: hypothetical protein HY541_02380, partial [Deltaproteobacteria bacterium]|nr:hypothetical protein [Deltaproteobacteria bacterium]
MSHKPPYIPAIINRIGADDVISANEFQQLEEALFAGDGVVDPSEAAELKPLLETPDRFVFDDEEDQRRLAAILHDGAVTIERYEETLALQRLSPRTPALSSGNGVNREITISAQLPTVEQLLAADDGSFELYLSLSGETILWRYQNEGDYDLAQAELFPIDLEIAFAALEDYRQGGVTETEFRTATFVMSTMTAILATHEAIADENNFDRPEKNSQKIYLGDYFGKKGYQNDPLLQKNYLGTGIDLYGQAPDYPPAVEAAFRNGLSVLPPKAFEYMKKSRLQVHLYDHADLLEKLYDENPDKGDPATNTLCGFTRYVSSDPKSVAVINVSSSLSPQGLSAVLVHEIGHLVNMTLQDVHGRFNPFFNLHFQKIREWAGPNLYTRFFRKGGAANFTEWFADAFAAYYLGNHGQNLPMGPDDFDIYTSVDFQSALAQFKQKDPVGYLLMARLDDFLRGKIGSLDDLLTTSAYNRAGFLTQSHAGDWETIEREWERNHPEREIATEYDRTVDELAQNPSAGLRRLEDFVEKYPHFTTARYYLIAQRLMKKLTVSGPDEIPSSLKEALGDFGRAFGEDPFHMVNLSLMDVVLNYDPQKESDFRRDLMEGPLVQKAIADMVAEIERDYPEHDLACYLRAKQLQRTKQFDEALSAYEECAKITPDKERLLESLRLRSLIFKQLNNPEMLLKEYQRMLELSQDMLETTSRKYPTLSEIGLATRFVQISSQQKALLLFRLGRRDEALEFVNSLKKDPLAFAASSVIFVDPKFRSDYKAGHPQDWALLREAACFALAYFKTLDDYQGMGTKETWMDLLKDVYETDSAGIC